MLVHTLIVEEEGNGTIHQASNAGGNLPELFKEYMKMTVSFGDALEKDLNLQGNELRELKINIKRIYDKLESMDGIGDHLNSEKQQLLPKKMDYPGKDLPQVSQRASNQQYSILYFRK
jgi:hypothetical protein